MSRTKPLEDYEKEIAAEAAHTVKALLKRPSLDSEELDVALGMAFASRYHWGRIGSIVNAARAEYLISRLYSEMGRGELSLEHATNYLDLIQSHDEVAIRRADKGLAAGLPEVFADRDLPLAYEALARASAVLGLGEDCRQYLLLARRAADRMSSDEDRRELLTLLDRVKCS